MDASSEEYERQCQIEDAKDDARLLREYAEISSGGRVGSDDISA